MSTRQVWSGMLVFVVLAAALGQPSAEDKAKQRDEAQAKAEALLREGKFAEAIEPATESVRLSRELYGEKHWRTFDAEHQLKLAETAKVLVPDQQKTLRDALAAEAKARTLTGDKSAERLKQVETALRGFEEVLGAESVEAAWARYQIGYIKSATDPKSSKIATEAALAIRRKTLPENHPDIAHSLYNLGIVQRELREYEAARKSYTEALAIRRKVLPENHLDIAHSLYNLGNVQRELREYEAAIKSCTEALAIRRKALPENHPDIARNLNNLGALQAELREYEAARKSHAEALAIRREILPENHLDIAHSLYNLGIVQRNLQEYEAARKSHTEALAIRRKALPENHPDIARSLNNLGTVQYDLGEYEAARKSYTEALAIRRKVLPENHLDIAHSLYNLGTVQTHLQEFETARKSHTEALAIQRKALPENHPDIAHSLYNLGIVQRNLREFEAARKSYTEALAIRRKVLPENHLDIAKSLYSLGTVQVQLQEYEAARKSHTEALAIRRKALPENHPDISASLNNLGNVQEDLREYEAARKSHAEALAIRRKALPENQPDIARSLNNLGIIQYDLREYEAARKSHTEALAIRRKALPENHPEIATSLNNLGTVQHDLREYEAARKSHAEALTIQRKALPENHPDIATSLNNLGNVQHELREFEAARKSHTEALAIRRMAFPENHPDIAVSLNNLGTAQHELGEFEAARKSYTEALAIQRKALPENHPTIAYSLNNLGVLDVCSTGSSAATQDRLTEALRIQRDEQTRLAALQAEPEQLAGAAHARKSVDIYLSATDPTGDATVAYHRVAAFKGAVTAFQRWARQIRNTSDPDTARLLAELAIVDREVLGAALPGEHLDGSQGPVDPRQRGELQERRARLERDLLHRSAAYRTFRAKAERGGNEIRTALPNGTCLIDIREHWHFGPPPMGQREPVVERRLVAFVVKPGAEKVVLVPLGPSGRISDLVKQWRETHGSGHTPPEGTADPAVELRKLVWDPLAAHLDADVRVVLVSPDGPLTGLPFAALPGSMANTFLLHQYAFVTVPVPALLPEVLENKPTRPDAPSLLLVGGIDFGAGPKRSAPDPDAKLPDVPQYRPLPGTGTEVNDLTEQFQKAFPTAASPTVLKKDEATKGAFMRTASKHTFLHLATHGFFAQESKQPEPNLLDRGLRDFLIDRVLAGRDPGLLSGVVFAGVNNADKPTADAILTALEAGELELGKTAVVVLSACETGRGKVADGEGVLGLQRAFQLAGARTVVASLWKVDDKRTQQLMGEFYRGLWDIQNPLSRAEALRQAQLRLLRGELENGRAVGSTLFSRRSDQWQLLRGEPMNATDKLRAQATGRGVQRLEPVGDDSRSPYFWAAFTLAGDWR